jgi:hypothetical protein
VPTTEPSINNALAAVLREQRRAWRRPKTLRSENTQVFREAGLQPDILITESGTSPVVVETEVVPAISVEHDARSRLGQVLRENGKPILSSVAVKLPVGLRDHEGLMLADALKNSATKLEYVCFIGRSSTEAVRWPKSGWISGTVADLCLVCQSMTIPPPVVEAAADRLVQGVKDAGFLLSDAAREYQGALDTIAAVLHQEERPQTRHMAMTIVANALIFHASLAGHGGALAHLRSVHQIRGSEGHLSRGALLHEWQNILAINYWPIFDIARQIVVLLPTPVVRTLLERLADTADSVLESGLTRSHDLVGAIFQQLIADRKFLAAFYTRPASAALLAGLALSPQETPRGKRWCAAEHLTSLRVADFACGTGTLLSTVYHVIRQYHELAGGDEEQLHPAMISDVLVGCDIMPAGTHITASMLSGAHPAIQYARSSILTMPFGSEGDSLSLGSLDLLQYQGVFPVFATSAIAVEGGGARREDAWERIPNRIYDLVIMNPPFVRPTNHEGQRANVPNPMFAAFNSTMDEQRRMSERLSRLATGTCYHGNAGEASAFLALAHRKISDSGTLALVMPLTLQFGASWEESRRLLREHYSDLCVVSIAAGRHQDMSFSADTGMAECLIVGTRNRGGSQRAIFVMLAAAPAVPLEGATIARIVREGRHTARRLEDGPVGGTTIQIGDDVVGTMLNAPLPVDGPWPLSRVADASVAQTAYQLATCSRLWLPSEPKASSIAICLLTGLADVGPLHRDINGIENRGTVLRGPFDIFPITPGQEATYPALWNHDADAERTLVVAPDSQALIRQGRSSGEEAALREKAARLWTTAGKCHFNYDFQFNSQSTAAVLTECPAIGGRAWPSINFHETSHEAAFVLWANSTLGLLLHWWYASKQQSGRGSITLSRLPGFPVYDFRTLTTAALDRAAQLVEELKMLSLCTFDEIDVDLARHEIDRIALTEVFPLTGHDAALDLLRRKLAREPSITGGRVR